MLKAHIVISGIHMLRKIGISLLLVPLLATALFLAGPRVDLAHKPRTSVLPKDIESYLQRAESQFTGIVPGAEKTIVWAHPDKRKTPVAIVYLHGFSATRQETAPLCDRVAQELGANLYYTRLTGHGLGGAALAEASVGDWLNDAEEALRIGEQLGDRVVIVGCSTGGALATWLAAKADNRHVLGYALISANFAPKDSSARMLTWPWARQFIPRLVGKTRQSSPLNEQHAKYWTTSYPTVALIPMMGVCKVVGTLELERIQKPLLMVYSPTDQVVDVNAIGIAYARWGSTQKESVSFSPEGKETHVIAGDIRAPNGTRQLSEVIVRFVQRLL